MSAKSLREQFNAETEARIAIVKKHHTKTDKLVVSVHKLLCKFELLVRQTRQRLEALHAEQNECVALVADLRAKKL